MSPGNRTIVLCAQFLNSTAVLPAACAFIFCLFFFVSGACPDLVGASLRLVFFS